MKNSETKQRILKRVAPVLMALTLVFGAYAANGSDDIFSGIFEVETKKPESRNTTEKLTIKSDSGKVIKEESSSESKILIEEALETEIEIEDWMLNANDEFWTKGKEENIEEEIEIEDWMIDLSYWQ